MHDDKSAPPDATSLAAAVASGDAAQIRRALAGVHPDTPAADGSSVLIAAIGAGNLVAVQILLDAGADPDRAGKGGETPVHAAAFADDPRLLQAVLAHGGNPDVRNAVTGESPLASAIVGLGLPQVRLLLEAGADPNAADHNGDTPLHAAGSVNAGGAILALLEAGARPMARNSAGDTFQPYYFQLRRELLNERALAERNQVVEWLRKHGVPLEAVAGS